MKVVTLFLTWGRCSFWQSWSSSWSCPANWCHCKESFANTVNCSNCPCLHQNMWRPSGKFLVSLSFYLLFQLKDRLTSLQDLYYVHAIKPKQVSWIGWLIEHKVELMQKGHLVLKKPKLQYVATAMVCWLISCWEAGCNRENSLQDSLAVTLL